MLGIAILTKINIGTNVQVFSRASDSTPKLAPLLIKTPKEINVTTLIITTSQTIIRSCKDSSCDSTNPNKF